MKKFGFLLFIMFPIFCWAENVIEPSKTRIVITGVLKWEDPSLSPFSDHNRKDKELYQKFLDLGVPKENITLLIDSEATKIKMEEAIASTISACKEGETFLFYYAGHGVKAKKNYFFCNYDYSSKSKFNISFLSESAWKKFKGSRIILLADCCYSGALLSEGEKISKQNKEVIVLSSATSSNVSTGNWTYTQTLLDNFSGLSAGDRNSDGEISLQEIVTEIKDAMKFRERQLSGFVSYGVDATKLIFQKVKQGEKKSTKTANGFTVDQYVYALSKSAEWKPARIRDINAGDITVEFYNYSDKAEEIIEKKRIRAIETPDYSALTKVKVVWEKKEYPAVIKKVDGDFYFIQYDGYDASWNEWVMYDRIITGTEKDAMAEWNSGWYKASVLQEKDGKCFITYIGYDRTWDEWAEKSRIKF